MDELEAPKEKHGARWVVIATCSALVIIVIAGSVFAVRDRMQIAQREEARKQTAEREKLTARIDSVQASLDALAGKPGADAEAVASITTQLTEVNTKLTSIGERLTALEEKAKEPKPEPIVVMAAPAAPAAIPTPAAPAGADAAALKLAASSGKPFTSELTAWLKLHPESAGTLAPLAAVAEAGIASESDLNRKLREALDDASRVRKVDDTSFVGKVNTHLSGLVSIKKNAEAGPYTKLRNDVLREDIDTLMQLVEQLSDADRKPLEDWLAAARARHNALAALRTLDGSAR